MTERTSADTALANGPGCGCFPDGTSAIVTLLWAQKVPQTQFYRIRTAMRAYELDVKPAGTLLASMTRPAVTRFKDRVHMDYSGVTDATFRAFSHSAGILSLSAAMVSVVHTF